VHELCLRDDPAQAFLFLALQEHEGVVVSRPLLERGEVVPVGLIKRWDPFRHLATSHPVDNVHQGRAQWGSGLADVHPHFPAPGEPRLSFMSSTSER
jgi:hypothetical protein